MTSVAEKSTASAAARSGERRAPYARPELSKRGKLAKITATDTVTSALPPP